MLTVHRSKGLEFPIVYVPFGWDGAQHLSDTFCSTTNRVGDCSTSVGRTPPATQRREASATEDNGRRTATAVRGADPRGVGSCPVVGASYGTSRSALHRLLLGRTPGIVEPARVVKVLDDGAIAARLATWPAAAPT